MFGKVARVSVTLLFLVLPAAAQQKRRVAVMDFGYGTVKTSVQAYFGTDQDIGKGISDLLIAQLLDGGDYRIIERSAMEKIVNEQNFSNSDRADPKTAAKIGGLLGVDAIIIGDITQFGGEDKHIGGGGGGGTWWQSAGGAARVNKSKTMVEITARMVDVNTGEILASVTGHGEVSKTGLGLGGGGHDGWKGGGGALDMGSSNFQQSAIGQAVKQSVAQVATGLDEKAATLPAITVAAAPPPPPLDALVADASTPDIIINVGSSGGVRVGDTLSVVRVSRVIKDPVTGKPLRSIEAPVGVLTITTADADSAVGKFLGSGSPKVGDHVKRQSAP